MEISEVCEKFGVEWSISDVVENKYVINAICQFRSSTCSSIKDIAELLESSKSNQIRFSAGAAQDIIAYLFFKGKNDGFYIDIGAYDGFNGSTTYWAEQIGWKGICVEPHKATFEQMQKFRKNSTLYNCALSNKSQSNAEFIVFPNIATRNGLANSLGETRIEDANKYSCMEKSFCSTKTFGDIMNDFPDINYVDFISIDTEGHEMQVLESIDFDKFSFGLMTVETQDGSDVVKFVESKGYKKFIVSYSDVIFYNPAFFSTLVRM